MLRECVRARENERARKNVIEGSTGKRVRDDHVSSMWNGTCFHTSMALLKLCDVYTFTYTHIQRERETHTLYTTVTKPSYLRRTV